MIINKMVYAAALCLAGSACGGGGSGGSIVEQFSPPRPKMGQQWTITTNYTQFDGRTGNYTSPYKITEVKPDNSYVAKAANDLLYYKAGNQGYGWVNGARSGTDLECWEEPPPATIFPLFVGKQLSRTATEVCIKPFYQAVLKLIITRAYSMKVVGVETLAIAGKNLKAVKSEESVVITQISTQISPRAGAKWSAAIRDKIQSALIDQWNLVWPEQTGDLALLTKWWSPELGIYVKINTDYTPANSSSYMNQKQVAEVTNFSVS